MFIAPRTSINEPTDSELLDAAPPHIDYRECEPWITVRLLDWNNPYDSPARIADWLRRLLRRSRSSTGTPVDHEEPQAFRLYARPPELPLPSCRFTKSAAAGFRRCPPRVRHRLAQRFDALAKGQKTWSDRESTAISVRGSHGLFRIRQGHYRAIYSYDEQDFIVVAVGHRREVYKQIMALP